MHARGSLSLHARLKRMWRARAEGTKADVCVCVYMRTQREREPELILVARRVRARFPRARDLITETERGPLLRRRGI